MEKRPYSGFYASLMGGFSISYDGNPLFINANPQCKYMQILLILLKAGNEGVDRKQLLDIVRPGEQNQDLRSRSLRQLVYVLRKMLAASGFPEGRYIVSKHYRYCFTRDYEAHTDTEELDRLIEGIRENRRERKPLDALYLNYCQAYGGEFLPMLSGEEWAAENSAYYYKWYYESLNGLCRTMKEKGEYETLLELCTAASQYYPYDGWQAEQIDCLMALGKKKEADRVYEEAQESFYQDFGVPAMDRVMSRYREGGRKRSRTAGALAGIKESLKEENEIKAPYQCSCPSFLDLYRIVARLKERFGQASSLLVCTLYLDGEEEEANQIVPGGSADWKPEQQARLEKEMERCRQLLEGSLRAEDAYTKYSKRQYLVLLSGADKENGEQIAERLKARWKENSRSPGAKIELMVSEVEGPGQEEGEECQNEKKEDICYTYLRPGKCHLAGAGHLAG